MDNKFTLLSRQRCRWAAGTTLAVVAAGSPLMVANAAYAAGTGIVNVHVTAGTGAPLSGQSVTLYSTATGSPVQTAHTTDGSGDTSFTGLDAGGYTAKVAASASFREEYTPVVVIDGDGDVEYASASLLAVGITQGRLTGTVAKPGNRLDAEIRIFPSTATNASIASGEVGPVAYAGANDYDYDYDDVAQDDWSAKLPAGSYKVLVGDDRSGDTVCHGESYDGYCYGWEEHTQQVWIGSGASNDADHAGVVTVTAGQSTGTAKVTFPGTVTPTAPTRVGGTVTGAGGATLADVRVRLFQQQEDLSWNQITSDWTGSDGTFSFSTIYDYATETETPLPAGVYTVSFDDSRDEYGDEFYDDKATDYPYSPPEGVTTLTLGATGSQTANAALAQVALDKSSGLNGKVTDDIGVGHAGEISVYDTYGNRVLDWSTRRDGTWSIPATQLAPGSYKVRAYDDVDISSWLGSTAYSLATTFKVPVKGTATTGNSNLKRWGSIGGTLSFAATAGTDTSESWITLYDADGERVDSTEATSNGSYTFGHQRPGTYYVGATGWRYSSFDESDLQVSRVEYIKQFWKAKFTLATATPIAVGSGGKVTGVNIALGRTLKAIALPSIVKPSSVVVGTILKSKVGTWNVRTGVTYKYEWRRGTVVVGRASSYKTVKADKGKTLTLRVIASDSSGRFLTGNATSAGVKVS